MQPLLQINEITRTFPGVTALEDVSVDVGGGLIHGVCGENGAGKSTLMAIIAGTLVPDSGSVEVDGVPLVYGRDDSRDLGVAIVRQEPALLPDLSVAENMYLKTREADRPGAGAISAWCAEQLASWDADVQILPETRVSLLPHDQRFIVEIVSALASRPKVLILDEPTEHLAEADVERLFEKARTVAAAGSAVIYISHRIREVRAIASVITVLRDGRLEGTFPADSLDEGELIRLIIGRSLAAAFPPKSVTKPTSEVPRLEVENLRGKGHQGVSISISAGEIVGFAGIDGNGQRETLRALAGLNSSKGRVRVDGREVRVDDASRARKAGISFVSGDRKHEGMIADLSVGDNIAFRNLPAISTAGFVSTGKWNALVSRTMQALSVKAPSPHTPIASLSGGNQQKAVIGGALESEPAVLLIDEPTQGVDVGSKVEIYSDLRARAKRSGTAIVITSSDAQELVGLCDRVFVFSRGSIVNEFSRSELTESAITGAALTASSTREKRDTQSGRLARWLATDRAPFGLIAATILLFGAFVAFQNSFYLSPFSITSFLVLATPLIFVALGQTTVMMTGGIDLSIGPLMGLLVVVASFWLTSGNTILEHAFGWVLLPILAAAVGALNWFLSQKLGLSSLIATLATYFALQSVSLVLRPTPGGFIDPNTMAVLGAKVGPIPILFVVAVVVAIGFQIILKKTRFGMALRAVGSDENAASLSGINVSRVRLGAHVLGSVVAACGAVALLAVIGSGDPTAGITLTLTSISAAVIGGASIFGGRGSYLAALLGAVLVQQLAGSVQFLGLSQAWENYLVGGLTLAAVATFSKARQKVEMN